MEGFIDTSCPNQPMTADTLKKPGRLPGIQTEFYKTEEYIIKQISEISTAYPSFEVLEKVLGAKVKRLPQPIKRINLISNALNEIPDDHFEIIIHDGSAFRPSRDRRKRPPRPRRGGSKPVRRLLNFIDYSQREDKRKTIITICRHLIINLAITYHRFLI
jgi:hypothetical protein